MMIICIWGFSLPCYGQARGHMGAGFAEMTAKGQACIYIGHSFAPHWSAECRAGFTLPDLTRSRNREWQEHDSQFSDSSSAEKPETVREMSIGVRYWPDKECKGSFLEVGIAQEREKRPFIEIGAGYGIPINRHLGMHLSYSIGLTASHLSGKLQGKGITLTIDYLF